MLRSYWKFQYPAADLAFALGVAFVVLKLMGYIDWSWWYVTLPFWGGAAVVLGVLLIASDELSDTERGTGGFGSTGKD